MRYAILSLLLLAGCGGTMSSFKVSEELLKECEETPTLEGMDGTKIMAWAKAAGPKIVECRQNHNALVTIIKAQ